MPEEKYRQSDGIQVHDVDAPARLPAVASLTFLQIPAYRFGVISVEGMENSTTDHGLATLR
jgi:hypothetical protein